MKLPLILAFAAAYVAVGVDTRTAADELSLVKEQSTIDFVGSKPEGKHKGGFQEFEVSSFANFEEPAKSSISIQIDAKSLWADDDKLANHLKNPDFFDVRNHPVITFESTEIVPGEKDGEAATGTIKGEMQMLGKTVAIEIPIKAKVTEETIEITTKFEIDRTKWGMTYGQGKINNEVEVSAKLTLKR